MNRPRHILYKVAMLYAVMSVISAWFLAGHVIYFFANKGF